MNNYVCFNYIMPGRRQIPSFQIASGTTNERDNSYNIPTGSIFFNTDTSNIELSGNVVASDISGVDKITFTDGAFMTTASFIGFHLELTNTSGAAQSPWIFGHIKFSNGVTCNTSTGQNTIQTAGTYWLFLNAQFIGLSGSNRLSQFFINYPNPPFTPKSCNSVMSYTKTGTGFEQVRQGCLVELAVGDIIYINTNAAVASFTAGVNAGYTSFQCYKVA